MSEIVGKTFESNSYGKFKVVKKEGRTKYRHRLYLVEFLETGYQTQRTKQKTHKGWTFRLLR